MGRAASINLNDVRNARAALIAADKPHGIIAIRKHIGRGSPQLISKLLRELDRHSPGSETASPQSRGSSTDLNKAWRTVSDSIESFILANDSYPVITSTSEVAINTHEVDGKTPADKLEQLEQMVNRQQTQLDKLEAFNNKLGEQLMQQQDLFDSWRHEQHAERQLLKTQLDQLMQVVAKKPARKLKKRGEQLDLYKDSKN